MPIFFVASGFMVSASLERQQGNWRRYFRNRAIRIFPGLWVCVIVTVIVTSYFGFHAHLLSDYVWLPAQFIGVIYTPPFLHGFGSGTYNGALWTIPLELQFDVVLPVIYVIAFRKRSNIALVVGYCYLQPNWPAANILALLLLATTAVSAAYTFPSASLFLKEQDISYGVYIYHGLIINVFVTIGLVGAWRDYLLLLVLTLFIASCSWRFVERPILRSKRKSASALLEPAL